MRNRWWRCEALRRRGRSPAVDARQAGRLALVAAVLTALWVTDTQGAPPSGRILQPAAARAVATTVLPAPPGQNRSEPHIALDPGNPNHVFVVAQGSLPTVSFDPEMLWRSRDGGRTWSRPRLMGFIDNRPDGAAGDPVVAAGRHGVVLFGTLAVKIDRATDTLIEHLGTRVSADGGRSFTAFGTAGRLVLRGPSTEFLDKEWLAVDATRGRFGGSAYLAWVYNRPDGTNDLLFAASRDGGRTYRSPLLLQHARRVELGGLEEYLQLAVRPNGTVVALWNGLRGGRPAILQAVSHNGGGSFSAPKPVVGLDPSASRVGIVTSLAVSPRGRLGLCWSQARPGTAYMPRVLCKQNDRTGRWGRQRTVLPRNRARQYLPAATFQGERLWVAAYVSNATTTRIVAVPNRKRGFGRPVTLNAWRVPSHRVCAPHPPACTERQTFIGDYIGAVATRKLLTVSYIEPVVGAHRHNRVLVSRLAVARHPQFAGG
jgi:hypothetical protein